MKLSRFTLPALAAAGVLALACADGANEFPTTETVLSIGSPCSAGDIDCIIDALFPRNMRNTFQKRYRDVVRVANNPSSSANAAESQATNVLNKTLREWYRGRLTDNSSLISQWFDEVFLAAGLPAPNIPPSAFTIDGALGVIGKKGGSLVTGRGWSGVDIPSGALDLDQLVVLTPLASPTALGQGPLNTDAPQYPLYFDVSIFSTGVLQSQIVVGMCVVDPPDPFAPPGFVANRLALGHNVGSGVQAYPLAPASFLDCTGAMSFHRQPGALGWLASLASRLFAPRLLEAEPGGLGGTASSLSPIAPVDPTAVVSVDVLPAVSEIFWYLGSCSQGQVQLDAAALDGSAGPIPNRTFTWSSSNSSIASVDQAGLVTAAGSPGGLHELVTITASTRRLDGTSSVAGTASVFVVNRSCGS